MNTFQDLLEQLKREDEVTILEILDMTSEDLVNKLEDIIFDKQDLILEYYGETSEDLD